MTNNKSNSSVVIDGNSLSPEQVEQVSSQYATVKIHHDGRDRVISSSEKLRRLAAKGKRIYGVNTGFGLLSDQFIELDEISELSTNLILSHAVGVGEPYDSSIVRAAMLIRANTLLRGFSGVELTVVETLVELINKDVVPFIPSQGSLGSSGDLAPLAHLALLLSDIPQHYGLKENIRAWYGSELMSGVSAMSAAGIEPCRLGPKDGLALTNGATFSAAMLVLGLLEAERLLYATEMATAMSFEALYGVTAAYEERLHEARGHPGQIASARRILSYVQGSDLVDGTDRIQDPYCLRCTPQVLGPVWELIVFLRNIVEREINAATDNPLIFDDEVISGGNFHGEPLGLLADYLKIALSEVSAISERRIFRLTSPHYNEGLPPMLVAHHDQAGLHSGLMMLQYTAASLVHENQHLANPNSIHSVPTSGGQEDFNANSTTAARHLLMSLNNLRNIVAVELICASQALEIRLREHPEHNLGTGTKTAFTWVRERVEFQETDGYMSEKLAYLADEIQTGSLLASMEY